MPIGSGKRLVWIADLFTNLLVYHYFFSRSLKTVVESIYPATAQNRKAAESLRPVALSLCEAYRAERPRACSSPQQVRI